MSIKRNRRGNSTGSAAAAESAKRERTSHRKPSKSEFVTPATAQSGPAPDESEIARLAYSYWETRGFTGGSPEDDWVRAEAELRQSHGANASA